MMNEINKYLDLIKNKKILSIGRIANTLYMGFDKAVISKNNEGKDLKLTDIKLFVKVPWRMIDKNTNKILFAWSDFSQPSDDVMNSEDFSWQNFEWWDNIGTTVFDEKAKEWISENRFECVKNCKINKYGDLNVEFSNNNLLEVKINSSSENMQCWGVFREDTNEPCMVVTGNRKIFFITKEKDFCNFIYNKNCSIAYNEYIELKKRLRIDLEE